MQVEANWKAAANLQLLLGETHPPVRIEHDSVSFPRPTPGRPKKAEGAEEEGKEEEEEAMAAAFAGSGAAMVDARNTANFRTTAYCSLQYPNAPAVRRRLIAYYQEMLRRIPLWRYKAGRADGGDGGDGEGDATTKQRPKEESTDDEKSEDPVHAKEEPQDETHGDAAGARAGEAVRAGALTFRAVGILTQVHDLVGEQAVVPWEFFMVRDIEDDSCFDGPINALLKPTPQDHFPLLFASARNEAHRASDNLTTQRQQQAAVDQEDSRLQYTQEGQRLSLYGKMLGPFTGLYPGMAVGIVGDPFQRSARGVLTGVLLRAVVLPSRPVFPWRVDRPLSSSSSPSFAAPAGRQRQPRATRVHFCSGPFPRRDLQALLRTVARQALHRGADVLIVGGPLVKPFEDFEKDILPSVTMPFPEMLDSFVDCLEDTLSDYYATRPNVPHMKVILVSHADDVTQVPVLPTTMYAMADSADVLFRSNPCRVAVNGVHFAVCNEDVVGRMRDVMVERWPTAEGSLRRVVEAMVQSRMYACITELPMTRLDMKHMSALRMDFVPSGNELLELGDGKGVAAQRLAARYARNNWDVALRLDAATAAAGAEESAKEEGDGKRVKTEEGAAALVPTRRTLPAESQREERREVVEYMPHIVFLPSTRPQFAYVTHRGVPSPTNPHDVDDESHLDDVQKASGVLVMNQEVWSRRASPRFELRVAEVTIEDSDLVARRGACAANGVSCGVLHIFNADKK